MVAEHFETLFMCPVCADLRARWEIRTPGELSEAIRIVQANLGDGTLVDITESAVATAAFRGLPEDGPWPDYIAHVFRCSACDQKFSLAVETYHGVGGEWEEQREQ